MLMELLDHDDLQHVMIYYKLGANFAIKIDKVYREQFGTMFDYFRGKITLEEFSAANKHKQVFGPDNLRRLVGIGFCGKSGRCRKIPLTPVIRALNLKHVITNKFMSKC